MLMVAIIIWLSAFASAFVDNIPFAATMIPIIKALAATEGVSLSTLAWALSMGTDIGGSATPIGASANVVGTSVAAKAGSSYWLGFVLQESSSGYNSCACYFHSWYICKIFLKEEQVYGKTADYSGKP